MIERQRIVDGGQRVLAALLAGFQRGAPPFVGFSLTGMDDGVFRDQWLDGCHAEFHGLLDDEIHVFALGNRLGQGDGGPRRLRRDGFPEFQGNLITRDFENLRLRTAAAAVEDRDAFPGADPQHLGEVFGLVSGEGGGMPMLGRKVEAGHGRRLKTRDGRTQARNNHASGERPPASARDRRTVWPSPGNSRAWVSCAGRWTRRRSGVFPVARG